MSDWKTNLYARARAAKWNLPYILRLRPGGTYSPGTFFFVISPAEGHPAHLPPA